MRGATETKEPNANAVASHSQPRIAKRAFFVQWLILGIALLASGATLTAKLLQDRTRSERMAQDRLSISAQLLRQQIEQQLASIDRGLLDLRDNLNDLATDHERGEELLAIHLRMLKNVVVGVHAFGILDAKGNVLASTERRTTESKAAQDEFFLSIRNSPNPDTLYVSEPFGTSAKNYSLNLSRATFSPSGEFTGIVTAKFAPETLKPMLTALPDMPDVSAGLIHQNGKVLIYSASPDMAPGTDVTSPSPLFFRDLTGGSTSRLLMGSATDLANKRQTALATASTRERSMNTSLVVAVSQERKSILKAWRTELRNQSALFLLLAGLSVAALTAYQRRQRQHYEADKRYQLTRRQDLDRLKLATEVSETGIWEFDLVSKKLTWDDTTFNLHGRPRNDDPLTYSDWKKCMLAEDLPDLEEAMRNAIEHRQEFDTRFRVRRDDGSVRSMEARASVYYDDLGQPAKIVGVIRDITKRQEAEQSLRESREYIIGILDSLTNHIAVLDAQGAIVSVNQAWRDFAKRNNAPSADLAYVGLNYLSICRLASGDGDNVALSASEGIQDVLSGNGTEFTLEYPCHSPNEERWFFMRVTRLCGAISGAVVSHENITARKLAERKVAETTTTTQQFIDHLPGTAYVKDENLRMVMANQAFQTMLGLDPTAMLGKTNRELFPGNFGLKLDEDDRKVLESGQSTSIDEDFAGRFFESRKFVIESENGKRMLAGITMDVTLRHKSFERQEALIQIGKLAGQLPEKEFLGKSLEMIERLTGSNIGFLHFVNEDQQSIELITWTPGALKGCAAVHESHYPLDQAGIWADCARTREVSMINDYPAYLAKRGLPEGHAHLQRFISVPVIDENRVCVILGVGNKTSDYDESDRVTAQLIGNDIWRITRRMRAEAVLKQKLDELIVLNERLDETNNRLLQSEKLASLGQLAAGVAHEINNPIGYVSSNLNSLAGYVEELLTIDALYAKIENRFGAAMPGAFVSSRQLKEEIDHEFIVKDIQHLLDESREGLARVRKIVQDLKDFSRIGETGWQRANLHEGLESTLNIVWNEIKYKAEVDRDYGELPDVQCIPSQINQVFLNLLTNAAQSIESNGHIGIRSGCENGFVWVEISDDGVGIPAELRTQIFDPFFTTKPIGQGTGLGLSLSWGIIQRHHGRIEVDSEVGRGTRFRIVLPIDQPTDAEADTDAKPPDDTTP